MIDTQSDALIAGLKQIAAEKAEAERANETQGPEGRNSLLNESAEEHDERRMREAMAELKASKVHQGKAKKEEDSSPYYRKLERDRRLRRNTRHQVTARRKCSRCEHLKKEVQDLQQLVQTRQKSIAELDRAVRHTHAELSSFKNVAETQYDQIKNLKLQIDRNEDEINRLKEEQRELVQQCVGDQQENQRLERIIADMLGRLAQLGGKQEAEDWVNDYTGLNGYDPRLNEYFE